MKVFILTAIILVLVVFSTAISKQSPEQAERDVLKNTRALVDKVFRESPDVN